MENVELYFFIVIFGAELSKKIVKTEYSLSFLLHTFAFTEYMCSLD
jgi:hypothetical protein